MGRKRALDTHVVAVGNRSSGLIPVTTPGTQSELAGGSARRINRFPLTNGCRLRRDPV